jgi:putative DNA methylase
MTVIIPKALIEVALPLDAINSASEQEKNIKVGKPTNIHHWWARRPLAVARAVIFGQLVHDPEDLWRCQNPGIEPNRQVRGHWTKARARLFKIIEDLVLWENTTNMPVLNAARQAIRESWLQTCELNKHCPQAKEFFNPDKMPGLHDPFAGGGSIPMEAQRLGLEAFASDLNPVAVMISKAMIEIPPKFAGKAPVHPDTLTARALVAAEWKGAAGLAEDIRRYGKWMADEAEKRIGHLYPKVEITEEMVEERRDLKPLLGQKLTVIAWIWVRTVKSPNPAFAHVEVPLASTFVLSSKVGQEAYVHPVIEKGGYRFTVKVGKPPPDAKGGTKLSRGANFRCLMSGTPMPNEHIYGAGKAGRMPVRLMAIVAEGKQRRVYLSPTTAHETAAQLAKPEWRPELKMPENPRWFSPPAYGLESYGDLFTPRQLVALGTLSDLVGEARERIHRDAVAAGLRDDDNPLGAHGTGARAYAEAVSVYLAFAVSRSADWTNSITRWLPHLNKAQQMFSRHAIPMAWDFTEINGVSSVGGGFQSSLNNLLQALPRMPVNVFDDVSGRASQLDASSMSLKERFIYSTDPPYYDNIGYADLSDFFYVWLRRSLRAVFPEICATVAVPKHQELVATPYRHGGKRQAEEFFLRGMTDAMRRVVECGHQAFPVTIYYAFKQSEFDDESGTTNTGWDTFLMAVIEAGFYVCGTWPVRTEKATRTIGVGTNALASSIILVCRPRVKDAGTISRRQFVRMLNEALPLALDAMTRETEGLPSPVAPVDLSQAIIGPGMAIFSRYDAVLEADGTPMSVKSAVQLINRFLAEDDFDTDTQFCLHWFEGHGWETGKFGEADTLARAKGTSVDGVRQAGVIEAGGGNVRLMRWREYPADWNPATDTRLPIWEALHHLIRTYNTQGDGGAAKVLAATTSKAEAARQLAYRLYTLCERKGWAEDARAYNEVVTGWSGIESAAAKIPGPQQGEMFKY